MHMVIYRLYDLLELENTRLLLLWLCFSWVRGKWV